MKKLNLIIILFFLIALTVRSQEESIPPIDTLAYTPKVITTSNLRTMSVEDTLFPSNVIIDGYLGVGVTSPLERLHINGAIRGNGYGGTLQISSDNGYIDIGAMNGVFANIYTDRNEFAMNKRLNLLTGELASYTGSNLYFNTSRYITRMTILDSNGFVGIGTTNPLSKLDINGNLHVNGKLGVGTPTPSSKLEIASLSGDGIRIGKINNIGQRNVPLGALTAQYNIDFTGYRDIALDQIGARIAALRFNNHIANDALVQKTGLAFYTNPSGMNAGFGDLRERMRISPEGNVGIGTTNPQHLLDVEGTIRAAEIKVISVDGLPDYVFSENYSLRPLNEVNDFIKANGHLPEMPSAQEVKENGMSLVEMNKKLLQKVEELTLYIIEQQRQIDKLLSK